MPVDVASAIPVKKPGQEPGSTIPVKVLGGCAVLLLATMLYNSIGGWHAQSHGQRRVQPCGGASVAETKTARSEELWVQIPCPVAFGVHPMISKQK